MTTTASLLAASASASDDEGSWLSALVDALVHLMDVIGPIGAGIAIAVENLFPPIPSEAVLPMAGLAASRGSFTLVEAVLWTTLGSLVGALALYCLGAVVGVDRLRAIAERLPLMEGSDVDRTVAWFQRHGAKAVLFGRWIPIFRSLISIPAGVARMPLPLFLLLTAIGSGVWNTAFVLVGFFLGEAWPVVEQYTGVAQRVVIAVVVLAVAAFVVIRVRRIVARRRGAVAETIP